MTLGEGRHESQVVQRAAVAGEREADERRANERPNPPVKSARSTHGVDYEARRDAAKSFKNLSWWAFGGGGEDKGGRLLNHDGSRNPSPSLTAASER